MISVYKGGEIMTLDELESQHYNVKLKDIRYKQLELLYSGFTTGTYKINITSFDGRIIKQVYPKTHLEWIKSLIYYHEKYKHIGTVAPIIEFNMQ